MENKDIECKVLTVGDLVTAQSVDKKVRTGTIVLFGEYTAIISCGVHRYVVKKSELEKQGYLIPRYRKRVLFSIN